MDQNRQDSRLKNTAEKKDASTDKSAGKLIEVKKRDNGEDKENKFLLYDKPFDEQMHQSFDDLRDDQRDEEAD
jgi:hypothetical protein